MKTLINKIKALWLFIVTCFMTNKSLRNELQVAKYELGRETRRSNAMWKELSAMRKQRREIDTAIGQINSSVDAIMIATARKYGKRSSGNGSIQLVLPAIDTQKLTEAYQISTEKIKNKFVVTVKPRPPKPKDKQQKCRVCGCTDDHACPGGCYWAEPDLCSRCAEPEQEAKEK